VGRSRQELTRPAVILNGGGGEVARIERLAYLGNAGRRRNLHLYQLATGEIDAEIETAHGQQANGGNAEQDAEPHPKAAPGHEVELGEMFERAEGKAHE
jgi:hypothetical protein